MKITLILSLLLTFFSPVSFAESLINLSNVQLIALQSKNALVIDIRTEKEWEASGIIPGSYKLQFFSSTGDYDLDSWLSDLNKLKTSTDQPIILVCRSGNRSTMLGNLLTEKLKMKNVNHLSSGIKKWIKEGHKTTKE